MDPETTPETIEEVASDATPDNSLDAVMDAVFDEAETPEQTEPKQEEAAVDESAATEEDAEPAEATPAASEPAPQTATGDPLTPEEELLLRRNGVGDAEMDAFRQLTVAQRNLLLRPARAAQQKLDHLYGLPKDERERALSELRQTSNQPNVQQDEVTKQVRQRLMPDRETLESFAADSGISDEAVEKLVGAITQKQAAYLAEIESERQSRAHTERASAFQTAVLEAKGELSKTFPKLAEDSELTAILNEPETFALWQAKASIGKSVGTAIKEALKERASVRYINDLQQQTKTKLEQDHKRAVRQTAEPTAKSMNRGSTAPRPKPRNVDEAMDSVWEEHSESTR
jgi:hypothetical protein